MTTLLTDLKKMPGYRGQLVGNDTLPARQGTSGRLASALPDALDRALKALGIQAFYSHQALAIDAALSGRYAAVVTATATSSGKSLAYNVPVLAEILKPGTQVNRETGKQGGKGQRSKLSPRALLGGSDKQAPIPRALYVFPTKALAQDQQRALEELVGKLDRETGKPGKKSAVGIATYDGDTPQAERSKVRKDAHIVITNPDMLHVGILPNHNLWKDFLAGLRYVIIDEAHVYRGIFGGHVANILRRLRRLCEIYGASPIFLCASATIANPAEHVGRLTGYPAERVFTVADDGAPSGPRTLALWNPPFIDAAKTARKSAQTEATTLFMELTRRGLRNITFTRSQKQAELILRYARDHLRVEDNGLSDRIAAYRGGYLPAQRREIEQALFTGRLIGVTATNALELGVDIGHLDATIHVGYPGTIASLRQQAGRAGRGSRPAINILVAQDNPLDQYFMRHPDELLGRTPEHALIDPENPYIVAPHVRCAIHEGSLTTAQGRHWFGPGFDEAADQAREAGAFDLRMGASEDDDRWVYLAQDYPAQGVGIRSIGGRPIRLVDADTGQVVEEIDAANALRRVYPGAVHLSQGDTYVVQTLDLQKRVALARRQNVNYYTETLETSEVRILRSMESQVVGPVRAHYGQVKVRQHIISYRRLQQFTETVLDETPVSLPPDTFETTATWWDMPKATLDILNNQGRDWLACMHAAEHACIGILPMFAMCDRWDIGGLSINTHPDTGKPQIIIYDGYPGGVGITEKGYRLLAEWWAATLKLIEECPCDGGCPSCVQSPKCGNNNTRLDKDGAATLLQALLAHAPQKPPRSQRLPA